MVLRRHRRCRLRARHARPSVIPARGSAHCPHLAAAAADGDVAARARRAALAWWALAVVVRTGYVPLAFGGQRHLWAATGDSGLLCAIMVRYAVVARRADRGAAALAVPEIAWTAFATVLSTAVARKNT